MNRIISYGCLFSIFIIAGCTSSDDDDGVMTGAASDLQGTWARPCEVNEDGDLDRSERNELIFSGSNVTFSGVTFINSNTCDSLTSITINIISTFSIDGTQTQLEDGIANNIDVIFSGGSVMGSPELLELLESQGTTLAALLAAQGITGDLNNLSLAELGTDRTEFFDIFRIDTTADGTDQLTFGDSDDVFTGDTPALRPISLDPDPNASLLRKF